MQIYIWKVTRKPCLATKIVFCLSQIVRTSLPLLLFWAFFEGVGCWLEDIGWNRKQCYWYISTNYQMKQTTACDLAKTILFHLCSTLGSVHCQEVVGSRINLVISSWNREILSDWCKLSQSSKSGNFSMCYDIGSYLFATFSTHSSWLWIRRSQLKYKIVKNYIQGGFFHWYPPQSSKCRIT